jgi:hypothetical protein
MLQLQRAQILSKNVSHCIAWVLPLLYIPITYKLLDILFTAYEKRQPLVQARRSYVQNLPLPVRSPPACLLQNEAEGVRFI